MSEAAPYSYAGTELELFLSATHWKSYWASCIRPFVRGRVLDVGAGIGATFDYLGDAAARWTCLEADAALCRRLEARLAGHARPPSVVHGTLAAIPIGERFDTLVYIDVLEHIEDDRAELEHAARLLAPGGSLIALAPALPSLFSAFDRSIGHFRRYTEASLRSLTPDALRVERWFFLDGLGVLASLFARISGQSTPTPKQVAFWDKGVVPISRITDRATAHLFGRSIVMIWTRP